MRDKVIRKACVWISSAVVMGCLGYSTLVLSAKDAYASGPTCEPEDCTIVRQEYAPGFCAINGGVRQVVCPDLPYFPDVYIIICNNGQKLESDCSGF
jgi:hypothetical protein